MIAHAAATRAACMAPKRIKGKYVSWTLVVVRWFSKYWIGGTGADADADSVDSAEIGASLPAESEMLARSASRCSIVEQVVERVCC